MAEGFFGWLRDAIFGRQEVEVKTLDIVNTDTDPRRSMVRFLKQIPGSDGYKKRELAKFFQSVEGQAYSQAERKQAYDELLGRERNAKTVG